ncbi:MAG: tocopherol cyclase family protein, partial [Calditrichia bacterium]
MFQTIRTTLKPTCYHGRGKKPPFFEGWYYKLIDRSGNHRYAIIPGVYLAVDKQKSHAFIQILNGNSGQSSYHSFPLTDFSASDREFDVRIGANRFTSGHLLLDIEDDGKKISGDLHFNSLTPWPVTPISPGIMGWYTWAPFMECYHGIVSLDHPIRGSLRLDGEELDFSGGRGYSEKDWGRSFPTAWVWLQSNHFP